MNSIPDDKPADVEQALKRLLGALDDEGWADDPSWEAIGRVEDAMDAARDLLISKHSQDEERAIPPDHTRDRRADFVLPSAEGRLGYPKDLLYPQDP